MANPLRWGIVGLGNISHSFTKDLVQVQGCELVAVASRSQEKAKDFGVQYGAKSAYGSYMDLFNDPEVDIVYIGTPHDSHASLSIQAMEHGKHVLCEKPLAVNGHQVQAMIESARENDVFLMEAFWSRFNPSIREVIDRVRKGDLGSVNYINADFTFAANVDDNHRLFNPELAGGSILDVGVYPLFLAYSLMGMPENILATGRKYRTGVDSQMGAIFEYRDGIVMLMSGLISKSDMVARICGDKGSFFISETWHETDSYTHIDNETKKRDVIYRPRTGKGFTHEIIECVECIADNKKQSTKWSWEDSQNLIALTDSLREKLDIVYPFEK